MLQHASETLQEQAGQNLQKLVESPAPRPAAEPQDGKTPVAPAYGPWNRSSNLSQTL